MVSVDVKHHLKLLIYSSHHRKTLQTPSSALDFAAAHFSLPQLLTSQPRKLTDSCEFSQRSTVSSCSTVSAKQLLKCCFKPVLNWANVCSPNMLRTLRRTMIRFLIELLVRRTWFGQFDELCFVLSWLVMTCKLRPELAADAQQTA